MTDNTQELRKIAEYLGCNADELISEVMKWHNKQIEEVLIGFAKEADTEYSRSEIDKWLFSLGAIVHEAIIEAERNKLKED